LFARRPFFHPACSIETDIDEDPVATNYHYQHLDDELQELCDDPFSAMPVVTVYVTGEARLVQSILPGVLRKYPVRILNMTGLRLGNNNRVTNLQENDYAPLRKIVRDSRPSLPYHFCVGQRVGYLWEGEGGGDYHCGTIVSIVKHGMVRVHFCDLSCIVATFPSSSFPRF